MRKKQPGAVALVAAITINAPASAADNLDAYRASCASLLTNLIEATGKHFGAAEALNWITQCTKAAQAKCDALPRTDGFCKGLREGF